MLCLALTHHCSISYFVYLCNCSESFNLGFGYGYGLEVLFCNELCLFRPFDFVLLAVDTVRQVPIAAIFWQCDWTWYVSTPVQYDYMIAQNAFYCLVTTDLLVATTSPPIPPRTTVLSRSWPLASCPSHLRHQRHHTHQRRRQQHSFS